MDHTIQLFVDLVLTLSVPEATNILLVVEGLRTATLLVISQDEYPHLETCLAQKQEVGIAKVPFLSNNNILIYNKTFFSIDQVQELSQDDSGLGRLLGYMASSDEMGSKYKIEYRVNESQLYAQVCRYLDDDRRCKAEEQLKKYQEFGDKLGLEIKLYIGGRLTPEGRPDNTIKRKEIWAKREEIANCLDKNFPRTAAYLRLDDHRPWLTNYRCYHRLWKSILRFNPEVEVPNLEMSLYQGWKLKSKTKEVLRNANINEQNN